MVAAINQQPGPTLNLGDLALFVQGGPIERRDAAVGQVHILILDRKQLVAFVEHDGRFSQKPKNISHKIHFIFGQAFR